MLKNVKAKITLNTEAELPQKRMLHIKTSITKIKIGLKITKLHSPVVVKQVVTCKSHLHTMTYLHVVVTNDRFAGNSDKLKLDHTLTGCVIDLLTNHCSLGFTSCLQYRKGQTGVVSAPCGNVLRLAKRKRQLKEGWVLDSTGPTKPLSPLELFDDFPTKNRSGFYYNIF